MKHLLLALLVAGLFGCSSSSKHADHDNASDDAKAAIETAAEDLKNAASEAEEEAKDAAEQAKNAAAEAQDTAASATDGFGTYEGTESSVATCTLGEDVRTIKVLNGATGGCGVVYNKMGVDKTVAVANNSMDYCGQTQEKVKGNLAAAGFTCQ